MYTIEWMQYDLILYRIFYFFCVILYIFHYFIVYHLAFLQINSINGTLNIIVSKHMWCNIIIVLFLNWYKAIVLG